MKRKGILGGIIVVVLVLVLALAVGGGSVSAEEPTIIASGDCGKDGSNVTWTLDSAGLLTISGKGEMASYTYGNDSIVIMGGPWRNRVRQVRKLIIQDSVTSIGSGAFYYCTDLTDVTIGNGVTSMGNYAFYGCTGLTDVTIGNGVTSIGESAFSSCNSIEKVHISDVAAWCRVVFEDNYSNPLGYANNLYVNDVLVTDLTIPNGVTSIGAYAFSGCTGLTSVTIPNSVTSIGGSAFYGCTGLTSVTIPDSVISIGGSAFYGCTGLTSVTIPDSVTNIGNNAFHGCTGLTEILYNAKAAADIDYYSSAFSNAGTSSGSLRVVIGDGVERIPGYLFRDCAGLTSVTIPDSVTSIGNNAFHGCTGLTEILYNAKAVAGLDYYSNVFSNAGTSSGGPRVVIGDGVEKVPSYLFYGCTGLTSVTIPDSVTSIGYCAFEDCTGLTSVTIPDSVTSIGAGAFEDCTGLTSVTIPDSVTSIGNSAFSGCTRLTEVFYNAKAAEDLQYSSYGHYVFKEAGASSDGLRVVIGDGVEKVPSYLFYGCTGLTEIYYNAKAATDLKESSYAFGNVGSSSGSVKVFIGEKVKKIPAYLFSRATNIREFEFAGDPPAVGYNALRSNQSGAAIYAYYPIHNSAWTESARKACGSYLTWVGYCYEPISTGVCKANKAVYVTGDTLDINGISMTVSHEDGCVETISYDSGLLELGSYDMSTVGVKLIDVSYKDNITAQLKVYVYERKTEVLDKAGYPESSHDYENNLDKTYTYEAKGAITLDVTFSPQTEVETNVDYLYVNGTKYTGTALAGKTITINGDTLTIRLVSDKSDSAYGFSIDRIVKTYINAETVVPPTCTERGYTMYLASGTVGNYVDALGHSFGDDHICAVCAAKLENIYISALPAKTVYSVGNGSLNLAGGKLMLVCDSGETEVILTAAMVSGFDNTVLGKQTLTVTVGGLTTTFEVEVVERAVTSVAVENGKLVKHYSDGTTEETALADGTISDFVTSETGEKTLTLSSENACVAAYKDADGNYVALKAVANEDGSYSYVVPEGVNEVTVAVKGDLDGDGLINMKDLARLRHDMADGTGEDGLTKLIIDLDGDGIVNMKDMGLLRRYLAGGYDIELEW